MYAAAQRQVSAEIDYVAQESRRVVEDIDDISERVEVIEEPVSFINLADYSDLADGDDWTVAIQAALDVFSADHFYGTGGSSRAIYVPPGTYEISDEVELVSVSGYSVHMYGGFASENDGAVFKWTGPVGGTMFHFRGVNDSIVERIRFDANSGALYAFRLQYFQKPVVGELNSSARNVFRNCTFASAIGTTSAAFCVGDDAGGSTFQSSELTFNNCSFLGSSTTMGAGWMSLEKGNTKNFFFNNCQWDGGLSSIDWRFASGTMVVNGGCAIRCGRQILLYGGGWANCTLLGLEVEGGSSPARLVEGAGGADPLTLNVEGCQIELICPDGTEADVAGQPSFATFLSYDPDIMIRHSGPMNLRGNIFRNIRTGSNPPYILGKVATATSEGPGSITSTGNFYLNADTWAPFVLQSGANLYNIAGGNDEARFVRFYLTSSNDSGGPTSAPTRLRASYGNLPTYPLLAPKVFGNNASVSYAYEGEVRRTTSKITVPEACFTSAATSQVIQVAGVPAKARVVGVYAEVTTEFAGAGVTAPVNVRVGHTSGGDEYLLDFDASALAQWGNDVAHLGADLAAPAQGGYIKSWTANTPLYLQLATTAGNVNLLTAGSISLYLTLEHHAAYA